MTSDKSRRVEIKNEDQTVAAAEVTPLDDPERTVRASLHPGPRRTPPGSRASLVDAVMDQPEVQNELRALGPHSPARRRRIAGAAAGADQSETITPWAGSTALVDADIPPASHDEPGQEPDGKASAS